MFKINFRLSVRSLSKNKLYSFINVAGLAIGLASAILIGLWIQNEVSHDRFHPNMDRLYILNNRDQNNGGVYVCFQAVRAALANPVKNLRTE